MPLRETIEQDSNTLALRALVWTLAEPDRAARLLALTGPDPHALRARADDPDMLAATMGFLESYEPDLIRCADAPDLPPGALISARTALGTTRNRSRLSLVTKCWSTKLDARPDGKKVGLTLRSSASSTPRN